ncbi:MULTISPECIES: phosphoadenosine phosphosulfate reductase [Roseobacteraceae]|jgi:hypothetical protein|uniref:Phosphoadenosine phosphosulfate reductase n=1 Tax=Pseudosulfitobacter pseudonitzschiae TaxID=1402135 RepID=A0A221K0X0_9RHOB|nr:MULTISPECIES: phosphoadenosine phosphosulfate reductase [Roseobacteraceae]ASM72619.1 phosphoadenosine phosphosulfate reductase [Pseudosulfitobacter pseudonitzschiae]
MQDAADTFNAELSGLTKGEWLTKLAGITEERGYFEPLGKRHFAAFVEQGTTLLVTFETIQGMRALSEAAVPLGWNMVRDHGWSHLCIGSDGDTWFRDEALYAYFDRLVDDGFFDEFETVVFYGAGPCGYAAAAYSVASPGATVLTIQPQATLDVRVTEWDDRFSDMRRTDFTRRYGYAPDMLDAAARAFVIYDPRESLDAMHAALFTRANVQKLRTRHMGDAIQTNMIEMDVLKPLLEQAATGALNDASFATLWRARRAYPPYLRNLLSSLEIDNRVQLIHSLCKNVTGRMNAPRFARKLKELGN